MSVKQLKYKAMTIIRFSIKGFALLIAAILLFSCNLEDFNLKKLTNKEDIIPDVYAPLAYGKFKVSDLVTSPGPGDNYQIPVTGKLLNSIVLSKTGTSFRNAAIDTVYMITHFTNNTPCDMSFDFSFFDSTTNLTIGNPFPSGIILAGAVDSPIKFVLGPLDQDNLVKATDIKLSIKIASPAGSSILYKAAKNTSFTINLSFYAPVNLRKL
jgi:hypothetical protein